LRHELSMWRRHRGDLVDPSLRSGLKAAGAWLTLRCAQGEYVPMDNPHAAELTDYIDRIRQRTMRVVAVVPPEKADWTYREGKFTFGDLMRHLAAIERWMFAENAQQRPSRYPGHGRELADGYDAALGYMRRMHEESMTIFRSLSDADL